MFFKMVKNGNVSQKKELDYRRTLKKFRILSLEWAEKAFKQAEVHYNLMTSLRPSMLKLTKHDDEIYKEFRRDFPDFDIEKINEEKLKTQEAKAKWRPFCNHFDGQIADFNQGCLLRIDAMGEYNESNTTLALRIQFLAIEIARNRELVNDKLYDQIQEQKKKAPKDGC